MQPSSLGEIRPLQPWAARGVPADAARLVLLAAIALLALVRLWSLGAYPLMDTTEARYADLALRMLQRGDWLMPWAIDGHAFWAKPPLSTWASAFGMQLLGINAFAARLPHYLMGLAVAALTWDMARQQHLRRAGLHAVALLAGSLLLVVAAGAVMTDMALTLGVTLMMAGYQRVMLDRPGARAPVFPWALVAGTSIAMLAKGPVALVLAGLPMIAWWAWVGRGLPARPPIAGAKAARVAGLLVLPGYQLAEWR
jgi:4-amino-4-deoxy-L-arabinose transferase-like glycosyltransferase